MPYSKEYQNGGLERLWAFVAKLWAVWLEDEEGKGEGIVVPNRCMKSVKFF